MSLRYNFSPATGDANTLVAGSTIAGNTIDINDGQSQKVYDLSVALTCDIETTSLTLACVWQVSNDGTTWWNVSNGSQNAAAVVLGTGTAGADATITKVVEAPRAVYGWRKARATLLTAGATGASADTYAMGYNFRNRF